MDGERGETIHYLSVGDPGVAAVGLREKRSGAHGVPYDRSAVGIHHLCIDVPSEYAYTPGYYAVYFYDPDGIKLELLHRPTYWDSLDPSP